jgi:chitin disaccharide deacetylase
LLALVKYLKLDAMKRIILCADDYGQNSAISQAIVELLGVKKLSATSCLVTSPGWSDMASMLTPFKNKVDVGMHFNLTSGKPLSTKLSSFYTLNDLIIKAHLKDLDKAAIIAEFEAQLAQFTDVFGQLPDFIDGHQHVHQFPIIRDAVIEVYEKSLRQNNTYMRCTYDRANLFRFTNVDYMKQLVIQLLGGIAFSRNLIKLKIPHNSSFAGIYDFKNSFNYSDFFPRFLDQVQDGGLIMCHPGLHAPEESDEINTARHNEYLYFCSQEAKRNLSNKQIKLVRFKELESKIS